MKLTHLSQKIIFIVSIFCSLLISQSSVFAQEKKTKTKAYKITVDTANFNLLTRAVSINQNVTHNGQKGIHVNVAFTAVGLKGVPCVMVHDFTDGSNNVIARTPKFSTREGSLRARFKFTPKSESHEYKKLTTFVPYSEFKLAHTKIHMLLVNSQIVELGRKSLHQFHPKSFLLKLPKEPINQEAPDAKFSKLWTKDAATPGGLRGINIYANMTTFNLTDIKSDIVFRLKKDGTFLRPKTMDYSSSSGQLSVKTKLRPKEKLSKLENLRTFLPYREFNLAPGTYDLVFNIAHAKSNGVVLKQFDDVKMKITIPDESNDQGTVVIDKIWNEFSINEKGVKGMEIHVKLSTNNLKGKAILLQTFFSSKDGPLKAKTDLYSTAAGHTSLNRKLTPKFKDSIYEDIVMFIPYDEFSLGIGSHLINIETKISTFEESTPLCDPKENSILYNKKLE